ncbi:hypothetical protein [Planomicrobium okeanokoites]|uniref:hypothetical protein n=1 Tax=Planomicrobium okeanokoites TaxID=244 RepID=UPI002491B478|nr:hypothetical protein [Planomicrobium okeanokoites]
MDWNKISNQTDIEILMENFGGFHDSCLKELYLWTNTFVDEDFSMSISLGLDTCVRALFQRQVSDPSAIELVFKGVTQFHMTPSARGQDSIIFGAKLLVKDGLFYWAGDEEWQPDHSFLSPVSWISARELHWRDASSWMGEEQRYGRMKNEETP